MGEQATGESRSAETTRSVAGVCGTPGAGPHMVIVLRLCGEQIVDARFSTYPCPAASACGEWITASVEGRTLAEAETITEEKLLRGTGPMPLGREHCPGLAVGALGSAIATALLERE